jgi:hypothetical protein
MVSARRLGARGHDADVCSLDRYPELPRFDEALTTTKVSGSTKLTPPKQPVPWPTPIADVADAVTAGKHIARLTAGGDDLRSVPASDPGLGSDRGRAAQDP